MCFLSTFGCSDIMASSWLFLQDNPIFNKPFYMNRSWCICKKLHHYKFQSMEKTKYPHFDYNFVVWLVRGGMQNGEWEVKGEGLNRSFMAWKLAFISWIDTRRGHTNNLFSDLNNNNKNLMWKNFLHVRASIQAPTIWDATETIFGNTQTTLRFFLQLPVR